MDNYGFNLGKFASVNDIEPPERAYKFWHQVRVTLLQRKLLRLVWNPSLKHTKFDDLGGDGDVQMAMEDIKNANDHGDDSWIMDIIMQRKAMHLADKQRAHEVAEREAAWEKHQEERKQEKYELAMERSAADDAAREKERVLNRYRRAKAKRLGEEIRRKIWQQRKQMEILLAQDKAEAAAKKKTAKRV